jgi:endonuclease YncB( thermonuclease family)
MQSSVHGRFLPRFAALFVALLLSGGIFAASDTVAAPLKQVPQRTQARVVKIVDGDTIDVESGGTTDRVRYIGMDTPERNEPLFAEATEANRLLVEGKLIDLVSDVEDRDRYDRSLRYIYLADGTFVNGELVRQGLARTLTIPPNVAHAEDLLQLQHEARAAGSGLWGYYHFLLYLPSVGHRGCVDLNRATKADLMLLDGIGEIYAQRIIEGRPWRSVDELVRLSGIGPTTVEDVRSQGLACVGR